MKIEDLRKQLEQLQHTAENLAVRSGSPRKNWKLVEQYEQLVSRYDSFVRTTLSENGDLASKDLGQLKATGTDLRRGLRKITRHKSLKPTRHARVDILSRCTTRALKDLLCAEVAAYLHREPALYDAIKGTIDRRNAGLFPEQLKGIAEQPARTSFFTAHEVVDIIAEQFAAMLAKRGQEAPMLDVEAVLSIPGEREQLANLCASSFAQIALSASQQHLEMYKEMVLHTTTKVAAELEFAPNQSAVLQRRVRSALDKFDIRDLPIPEQYAHKPYVGFAQSASAVADNQKTQRLWLQEAKAIISTSIRHAIMDCQITPVLSVEIHASISASMHDQGTCVGTGLLSALGYDVSTPEAQQKIRVLQTAYNLPARLREAYYKRITVEGSKPISNSFAEVIKVCEELSPCSSRDGFDDVSRRLDYISSRIQARRSELVNPPMHRPADFNERVASPFFKALHIVGVHREVKLSTFTPNALAQALIHTLNNPASHEEKRLLYIEAAGARIGHAIFVTFCPHESKSTFELRFFDPVNTGTYALSGSSDMLQRDAAMDVNNNKLYRWIRLWWAVAFDLFGEGYNRGTLVELKVTKDAWQ